jgi:RHS repeat-associated protein
VLFTGLDYADQRYYASGYGRFISPDRITNSNATVIPSNWNRYAYVSGDPINKGDPRGMCSPDDDPPCFSTTGTGEGDDGGDDDVAMPQIGRGASPSSQAAQWLALVQKRLVTATNRALQALKSPKCAKLFGIADPSSLLSDLIQNYTTIGPIKTSPNAPPGAVISATTTPRVTVTPNGTFEGADIKINDVAGAFVTGTLTDQAVTLLHELGHAVNDTYGSDTSQIVNDGTYLGAAGIKASQDNTALVLQNCFR